MVFKSPLFVGRTFHTLKVNRFAQMREEINKITAENLLKISLEDMLEYILSKYRCAIPVLQEDKIESDLHTPSGRNQTDYVYYVPFEGDRDLFEYRPSEYIHHLPRAEIKFNKLIFSYEHPYYGNQLSHEDKEKEAAHIRTQFSSEIERTKILLASLEKDAQVFHRELEEQALSLLESRRAKFQKDQDVSSLIGYPLRKRADAETYIAPIIQKPLLVRPSASAKRSHPEPALEMKEYENILAIIHRMTQVIERSPKAFETMDEESLRQHFLVQLNGVYEGQARRSISMGRQTFSFVLMGKTFLLPNASFGVGQQNLQGLSISF